MKFPEPPSQRHQQDLAACDLPGESPPLPKDSSPQREMPMSTKELQQTSSEGSADSSEASLPSAELQLLARLEEANRMIEADAKSLNSLSGASGHSRNSISEASGHSRKSSTASQISLASVASHGAYGGSEETEEDGWCQWGRLVTDWDAQWKRKTAVIRDMVHRGVPHHFRPLVWQLLCHAEKAPEKKLYSNLLMICSPYERQIRRDIYRTYPEHDFFKEKDGAGQEALFNVIKAYSLHDREVGYCQGTAFIVGLLLLQMPEEEAFAVLVKIMQTLQMRDMYKPPMALLGLCLFQLENMIQEQLPELQIHFTLQSVPTSMYASSWFLTLFTTMLPLSVSCRIMDVFLLEGLEIIFKIAMAFLTMGKDDLMTMDMEAIQKYFHKDLPERAIADPESLMNLAYSMKYNPKKMKKLEKEYTIMKSKEQAEMSEIKKLRSDNRSMRCVIDNLELESASLAEKLVRWQVEAARGAETEFALQQQLAVAEKRLQLARDQHYDEDEEGSRESSLGYVAVTKEEMEQRDEMITCLQEELVKVRLSEAENDALIKELRGKIAEMEQDQKSMREMAVDNSVAHLQEELIAVKLREAEANLSLKDLRQRVAELSDSWTKHLQTAEQRAEAGSSAQSSDVMSTPKKLLRAWENRSVNTQKLEDELMSSMIREMEAVTELKELRLKLMELETQVQVSTNQLRRQDEEKKTLVNELEEVQIKVREMMTKHKEQNHRLSDLQTKNQYDQMLVNIRNAEDAQKIAELNQEISILKMKNQVILTEGELRNNLGDSEKVRDLQDVVADLKAEVLRLKAWKSRAMGEIPEARLQAMDKDLTAEDPDSTVE